VARKLRIQFEGAIYHVINRGNYRRNLFESASAIQAFEGCIFEAFDRFKWRLHAFSLMINHYHLVMETPATNLPEGMQWLQSTYATRFNRFRDEHGHLFQGRYKAILVEPGPSLARVVNYAHLNPVGAGIVRANQAATYRWSSLHRFLTGPRPRFLKCEDWLLELGIEDTREGWEGYLKYLEHLANDKKAQQEQGFETMQCGWAIGTYGWRQALAKNYAHLTLDQIADVPAVAELRRLQWAGALDTALQREGRPRSDLANDRKGAPWKVRIAAGLRETTTATNTWIARELNMGAASSVRQYLSNRRRNASNL
jgi:REP element-mobilizing transposase RayT